MDSMFLYFPGWAGVFAIYHPDGTVYGRHIRFIEHDPETVARARRGRTTPWLLVSLDEVPPTAVCPFIPHHTIVQPVGDGEEPNQWMRPLHLAPD